MYVRHADASGKYEKYLGEAESKNKALAAIRDDIIASGDCIDLNGLAISGSDIAAAGIRGKNIGLILDKLLEDVITERLPNKRSILMEEVKKNV